MSSKYTFFLIHIMVFFFLFENFEFDAKTLLLFSTRKKRQECLVMGSNVDKKKVVQTSEKLEIIIHEFKITEYSYSCSFSVVLMSFDDFVVSFWFNLSSFLTSVSSVCVSLVWVSFD